MSLVEPSCSASQKSLDICATTPSSPDSLARENSSEVLTSYTIECRQESAWALILFTRHECSSRPLAIKVLREYQDTRYSLETLEKRQQYQLETLKRNRIFTPDVYLGIARVHALDLRAKTIQLGEILPDPSFSQIDPHVEYALIMQQLPDGTRLDILLVCKDNNVLNIYMRFLAVYIAHSHERLIPSLSHEEEVYWGGYKQLEKKLQHNLDLLDLILLQQGIEQEEGYHRLEQRLSCLKERMRALFKHYGERGYFEQRVEDRAIKHCHGDLKTPHIWIDCPDERGQMQGFKGLSIVDAADFNPSYTHIDVLSDLAMLAIDIQTRTQSPQLADRLLQEYLESTNQKDMVSQAAHAAQAVLAYYLIEKAIVGAAISLVYDGLPDLGWAFLRVAETRLDAAEQFNSSLYQEGQQDRCAAYTPAPARQ